MDRSKFQSCDMAYTYLRWYSSAISTTCLLANILACIPQLTPASLERYKRGGLEQHPCPHPRFPHSNSLLLLCGDAMSHRHPLFELDIKLVLHPRCGLLGYGRVSCYNCFRRCKRVHCFDVAEYAHADDAHIVSLQTGTTADQHWPLSVASLHATGHASGFHA